MGNSGPPVMAFKPIKKHTHSSAVNLTLLPGSVTGVLMAGGALKGGAGAN